MATPSYEDLVGRLKESKAPAVGPVTPSRPRERSPMRGDRRPIEVQRREQARMQTGGGVLFPGGDGREEAMARRSKTIPKPRRSSRLRENAPQAGPKPKEQPFLIGREKRPAGTSVEELRQTADTRKKPPNPAFANTKRGEKRKATDLPGGVPQASRKPPPKPQGRLGNSKKKVDAPSGLRKGNRKG
jgi:hypothetical protein